MRINTFLLKTMPMVFPGVFFSFQIFFIAEISWFVDNNFVQDKCRDFNDFWRLRLMLFESKNWRTNYWLQETENILVLSYRNIGRTLSFSQRFSPIVVKFSETHDIKNQKFYKECKGSLALLPATKLAVCNGEYLNEFYSHEAPNFIRCYNLWDALSIFEIISPLNRPLFHF